MLKQWLSDLLGVIFPNLCEVCGKKLVHGERMMCLNCLTDIPQTQISGNDFTEIHKRLAYPGMPIDKSASWFYYRKDSLYAKLIQKAKYNNRPAVARQLAELYARQLLPSGFFNNIDIIIPVPISLYKRLRRGYNQSAQIAKGISEVTGIPWKELLKANNHSSQTKKDIYNRWANARSVYRLTNKADLSGKNILIVDDVITSGATMVSCILAIRKHFPAAKCSVLSLSLAYD